MIRTIYTCMIPDSAHCYWPKRCLCGTPQSVAPPLKLTYAHARTHTHTHTPLTHTHTHTHTTLTHTRLRSWSKTSPKQRSAILLKIADLIEEKLDEFAEAESRDQGKPVWLAKKIDIPRAVHNFRFFATGILHSIGT